MNFLVLMKWDFDISIIEFFNKLTENSFLELLFKGITFLGTETAIMIVLCLLYWCFDKEISKKVAIATFFSLLLTNSVKSMFNRLRPFQMSPDTIECRDKSILSKDLNGNYYKITGETGEYLASSSSSFPSGHSTTASSFYNSFAYQLKKKRYWIISTILCLLVMISRMSLGVHFLTDVLVGYFIGLGLISLYFFLKKKTNESMIVEIIFISIFGILTFISPIYSDNPKDLFSVFGSTLGFVLGSYLESKHVNFRYTKSIWKNILRFIIGFVLLLGIRYALKLTYSWAFEEGTYLCSICDMIRYFAMVFVGIYVYPLLFKKLKFLNDKVENESN